MNFTGIFGPIVTQYPQTNLFNEGSAQSSETLFLSSPNSVANSDKEGAVTHYLQNHPFTEESAQSSETLFLSSPNSVANSDKEEDVEKKRRPISETQREKNRKSALRARHQMRAKIETMEKEIKSFKELAINFESLCQDTEDFYKLYRSLYPQPLCPQAQQLSEALPLDPSNNIKANRIKMISQVIFFEGEQRLRQTAQEINAKNGELIKSLFFQSEQKILGLDDETALNNQLRSMRQGTNKPLV